VKYAVIEKRNIPSWVEFLKTKSRVYAPARKENLFVFAPVDNPADISLEYVPTVLPPKKYYFPPEEDLLKFTVTPFKTAKAIAEFEPFILFAVHTCDIAGLQCMDVVFKESPEDPNYLNRREKMAVIGIECLTYCDTYATCASVGNHEPRGGYDLMMVDCGTRFVMHVNSSKGEELVHMPLVREADARDMEALDAARLKKKKAFKHEFNAQLPAVYEAFDSSFTSPVWKDVGRRCVGCGNCTAVCPTCYCFDVQDTMDLTLNSGTRSRIWNSCQMEDFAKVAGGEDFRKGRDSRQRHRYYRKFKYPVDKFNRYFCTGCGRCSRACMAGIVLRETVNALTDARPVSNKL
jgi:sulfhydrogenase subunit beta (sulfur reductase)